MHDFLFLIFKPCTCLDKFSRGAREGKDVARGENAPPPSMHPKVLSTILLDSLLLA